MNWILKYKLYHIPFWAAYHYAWWSIYAGDPIEVATGIFSSGQIFKYLFYVIFQAIGVYFCLYYLFPKFLEKGKYRLFLLYVLMSIIVISFCIIGGYYLSAHLANENVFELYNVNPPSIFSFFKFNTLPSTISVFTLGMSIKLAKNWIQAQKRERLLEKEKLETELKFLKSQFNPHFLFNTINSVFFLIDNNPVMASETLAKFSGLLRYQLYECNEPTISLDRELEYLKGYIELQEIRLNDNVEVFHEIIYAKEKECMIAPFILMPFVENSFKHVSHHSDTQNWIHIQLSLQEDVLTLQVSNSRSEIYKQTDSNLEEGGIGLKNVKRRLALLYPDQYELDITEEGAQYIARLKIQLVSIPENQLVSI